MITDSACPKSLSLQEIREATAEDPNLIKAKEALKQHHWRAFLNNAGTLTPTDQTIRQQLWRVRDELSASGCGLVLRGQQIVVPQKPWNKVIGLTH